MLSPERIRCAFGATDADSVNISKRRQTGFDAQRLKASTGKHPNRASTIGDCPNRPRPANRRQAPRARRTERERRHA